MSKKLFDVVVAGHVCLDIIPRFRDTGATQMSDIMAPGKLVNVDDAAVATGGPVSNTGLGLIKLGMKTGLMGKIGDDFFGDGIRALFEQQNAADALTTVPGEMTSYTIVLAPPGIDRIFLHNPGANNTFRADDVNYDIVAQSRLFHLGYPPLMHSMYANDGQQLIEIFRRVKDLGVTTSLDMSLPDPDSESGSVNWDKILTGLLPYVDIAPLSAEEVLFMTNRTRFDQLKEEAGHGEPLDVYTTEDLQWIGSQLLERGAAIAAVKCGHRGMLLFTSDKTSDIGPAAPQDPQAWNNRELWEEAFQVDQVASATGSGDSSIAGLLSAILRGCTPEAALASACCTGGQNVKVLDAVSGIHTWEETQQMQPTWPKSRQNPGPNWNYDNQTEATTKRPI